MHDLEIQRGRFSNTPRSMRWCRMCLTHGRHEREDDGHLAFECPFYEEARLRFPRLFQGLPLTGSLDGKMQDLNCPRVGGSSHYDDYGAFWGDMAGFCVSSHGPAPGNARTTGPTSLGPSDSSSRRGC